MVRMGWKVRTQVGVSAFRIDLGVVHPDAPPGAFLAGVECGGATDHRSATARDRERRNTPNCTQLHHHPQAAKSPGNVLSTGLQSGADDGTRTRDVWNHNPVL